MIKKKKHICELPVERLKDDRAASVKVYPDPPGVGSDSGPGELLCLQVGLLPSFSNNMSVFIHSCRWFLSVVFLKTTVGGCKYWEKFVLAFGPKFAGYKNI